MNETYKHCMICQHVKYEGVWTPLKVYTKLSEDPVTSSVYHNTCKIEYCMLLSGALHAEESLPQENKNLFNELIQDLK